MPDYYKYSFQMAPAQKEIFLALLSDLPFDTFEETENGWDAYLPVIAEPTDLASKLEDLKDPYPFSVEIEKIPSQNWNAVWESNFQPILVDDFCGIRAEFHPPIEGVQYELIIHPRMAFGTGHHETTYMMMQAMRQLSIKGARVFDYGCGTGILAILAAKMGAGLVEAVDIEEESYENTLENAKINHVTTVNAYCGDIHAAPAGPYQIILANINRNVILDSLSALYQMLAPAGALLVSGILQADAALVIAAANEAGFHHRQDWMRGDWQAILFEK